MSGGSYKQVDIGCPFYRRDDGCSRIVCEGPVDDSSVSLWLASKQAFDAHIRIFCGAHYKNCEVYKMANAKYEED